MKFTSLLGRLVPSGAESAAVAQHRASIEACLRATFTVQRFFRSGSFGLGTSVRFRSDVDYFLVLPTLPNGVADSAALLRSVRLPLVRRFSGTAIRVDSPAVVVPFGASTQHAETTEIVPAIQTPTEGLFLIANGSGGWMLSAPEAHNAFVRRVDAACGGRTRSTVRLMKYWARRKGLPITSFYLEMVVTSHFDSLGSTGDYALDLRNIFYRLMSSRLSALADPLGIAAPITPTSDPGVHARAMVQVRAALAHAIDGCEWSARGFSGAALAQWEDVLTGVSA